MGAGETITFIRIQSRSLFPPPHNHVLPLQIRFPFTVLTNGMLQNLLRTCAVNNALNTTVDDFTSIAMAAYDRIFLQATNRFHFIILLSNRIQCNSLIIPIERINTDTAKHQTFRMTMNLRIEKIFQKKKFIFRSSLPCDCAFHKHKDGKQIFCC